MGSTVGRLWFLVFYLLFITFMVLISFNLVHWLVTGNQNDLNMFPMILFLPCFLANLVLAVADRFNFAIKPAAWGQIVNGISYFLFIGLFIKAFIAFREGNSQDVLASMLVAASVFYIRISGYVKGKRSKANR
jgi:hypothetical protein